MNPGQQPPPDLLEVECPLDRDLAPKQTDAKQKKVDQQQIRTSTYCVRNTLITGETRKAQNKKKRKKK